MKIYTTIQKGDFHTNNCEDFLIVEDISSEEKLIAVMDGCTMGKESAFASMLIGKLLRKIAKKLFYGDFVNREEISLKLKLQNILKDLFTELKYVKNQLDIETNELLSTIILGLINHEESKAELIAIGDGLIFYDGKLVEYEQNNMPDYIGYHLDEDFNEWYCKQEQRLLVKNFKDLSICTDGVFTFKNFENRLKQKSEIEIIEFLLKDDEFSENENMLDRKIRSVKEKWNHIVSDDLAIIRIIK